MISPEADAERLADTDYEDVTIESMEAGKDGYTLTFRDGLTGFFSWDGPPPEVGGMLRVYTTMLFGHPRNGHAYFTGGGLHAIEYKSKAEREAERQQVAREYGDRRTRGNRESRERYPDLSFLPLPLQRRIQRFRDEATEHYHEPYELAPVLEAARLFERVQDPAFGAELKRRGIKAPADGYRDVHQFRWPRGEGRTDWPDTPEWRLTALVAINSDLNDYDYELQEKVYPEIDRGHSGNTWDHAVVFARALLRDGDEAQL